MPDPAHHEAATFEADGWRRREVEADTLLWQAGDLADRMLLLTRGLLRVEVEDKVLEHLGPGEILGELAALGSDHVRTATVVAEEPAVVWELDVAVILGHREARGLAWHRILDQVLPQLARRVDRTRSRVAAGSTVEPVDPADPPTPARWETARQALAAVPWLAGLSPATLDALGSQLSLLRVEAGTELLTQGAFASRLLIMASGRADLVVDGAVVGEFRGGTLLGADALLHARAWRSTVRTTAPSQVLSLARDHWWELRDEVRLDVSEALFDVLRAELLAANRAS